MEFHLADTDILMAAAIPAGAYVSMPKLLVMFLLLIPWIVAIPWIFADARKFGPLQPIWTSAALGCGVITLLAWLMVPIYLLGLAIHLVLTWAVCFAYIYWRDQKVPLEGRVLSAEHLKGIVTFQRKPKKVEVLEKVKIYGADGKIVMPPGESATDHQRNIYNTAQSFLYDVIYHRASEADVAPAGKNARVRFVIDGVVNERLPMEIPASQDLIQFIKGPAGMDTQDVRKPQKGSISIDIGGVGNATDMMITTAGTTHGQKMRIKIVQEIVRTDLEQLGISKDVLEQLRNMNASDNGLIIVSAPPGNGLTSTLYSLLREHDAFIKQIMTIENKKTIDLENVTQKTYDSRQEVSGELTAALRLDPAVIMIDQCPDRATAELITDAAKSKCILLGIRAQRAFQALAKWIKVRGDNEAATENLLGVLCQVLVRKLCPNCRQSYRPDPKMLSKANIPADKGEKFFRPPTRPITDEKGNEITCMTCQGTGYFGRTGVFELLKINDDIRNLIIENASLENIKSACRRHKMLYLQEQALKKVIQGETGIKEVIRVTQSPQSSGGKKS